MGTSCSGVSTATITGNTTKTKDDNVGATNTASQTVAASQANVDVSNPWGFGVTPPPAAPDFTTQAVKARRAAQALALLAGRGRAQAFAGGNSGSAGALSAGSALG